MFTTELPGLFYFVNVLINVVYICSVQSGNHRYIMH